MLIKLFFLCVFFSFAISDFAVGATKLSNSTDPILKPHLFISSHQGTFNNQQINYTAIAGETYLKNSQDKKTASIFSFSYIKNTTDKNSNRPVTFVWNGGPGFSSVWLHMGGYGPKVVELPANAQSPNPAPYAVLDNPQSILDTTDLVFVDPVGTGFSRAIGDSKNKDFWGLHQDANAMAQFIKAWITDNNRWNSPRFIVAQSYGTTRAALVAKILEQDLFISLNGLIFISQALDFQGSSPYIRDNLISYITYLPTMAATAAFHGKIQPKPDNLAQFLNQAKHFATNELMPALFKGNSIDQKTANHIQERLAYFTGLDQSYIELANLRIQGRYFAKQLLKQQGLSLGILDTRYTIDEIDNLKEQPDNDAAFAISSSFNASLMSYLRNELGVKWRNNYLFPVDNDLDNFWDWRPYPIGKKWEPSFVNTANDLSLALRINPSLKVLVASGYYDLMTPFFDAQYTLNRHDIKADKIEYKYYHSGHMIYANKPSRLKLLEDSRKFIQQQIK